MSSLGAGAPVPESSGRKGGRAEPRSGALLHLEWDRMLDALRGNVVSQAAGDRICTGTGALDPDALLPRTTAVQVNRRRLQVLEGLQRTLSSAAQLKTRVSVAGELAKVEDVAPALARASRDAVLDLSELCRIQDVVEAADALHRMFSEAWEGNAEVQPGNADGLAALREALAGLRPPAAVLDMLRRSLERGAEPALADTASEALGGLRRKQHKARRALTAAAEKLLRRPSWSTALADGFWTEREGRVVLPVRSSGFSRREGEKTVSGIIHGSSGSGQTLFVEPHALIDDNNAVRETITAVRTEERRIMARLSRSIGEAHDELGRCLDALVELDLQQARLRLCEGLKAEAPELVAPSRGAVLRLPRARHPLMVLRGAAVVPNDLEIAVGTGLIISGPNAGGKTVALKTMGLCTLMATAGLRVPASAGAVVPLFGAIVTDVGDDQSIAADLSTFSAHVGHVCEAFEAVQDEHGALVLLDEVAAGTDPQQGAALAEAIAVALVERGATLVATTHYERLKLLATTDPRFVNAAVGFDLEELRPTFEVRIGAPGSSSALAVAKRLGLPTEVVERARSLLADEQVRLDELLQQVEGERTELGRQRAELDAARSEVEKKEAALADRDRRDEESAARKRKQAHDAATSALRGLEDELKRRRKALRRDPALVDASGVTDPQDRGLARAARTELQTTSPIDEPEERARPQRIEVGDRVRVSSLGASGEVVEVRSDKVTVQLGAVRTTVEPADLRVAQAEPARKKRAPARQAGRPLVRFESQADRYFGADPAVADVSIDRLLDVRGQRVDEAIEALEVFLDRAIAADHEVVVVRHGYGSGALRKTIREHLPRLGHVKKHRSGLPAEGGDAVTVVWVQA